MVSINPCAVSVLIIVAYAGYVQIVVLTILSCFPPGETRWMPLMEAELPESHGFSNIRVAQSLVFCVVLLIFWREMFAFFLSLSFWQLHCLFFLD
jgi:hypothetical protein